MDTRAVYVHRARSAALQIAAFTFYAFLASTRSREQIALRQRRTVCNQRSRYKRRYFVASSLRRLAWTLGLEYGRFPELGDARANCKLSAENPTPSSCKFILTDFEISDKKIEILKAIFRVPIRNVSCGARMNNAAVQGATKILARASIPWQHRRNSPHNQEKF